MADFANLVLGVDTRGLKRGERALDDMTRAGRRTEQSTDQVTRSTGRMGRGLALAAAGALAAAAAMAVGSVSLNKFISGTVTADKAQAQLAATITSTGGAAGKSVDDLNRAAAAFQKITNFGDEATNAMQGVLLTFTNIRGDVFDQATESVLDLATAMGMDLRSAALQVGKALNDPVLGMTALGRAGIQFTVAQKKAVKAMVETNNVAGAQALILKELETQFGGSAEAARNTLGGALASLGNAWGDLFELSGPGSENLRASIERLTTAVANPAFFAAVQAIGTGLFAAAEMGVGAMTALADNMDRIAFYATAAGIAFGINFVGGLVLAQGATATLTGAMVALKGAIAATGIGVFVILAAELALTIIRNRDAADKYSTALAGLAGEQERLNTATETFYQNMNTANLAAMKLQAERARDAIQAALEAAKAELEAASFYTNLFGASLYETDRMAAVRAEIERLNGNLMESEARISAADNAALNMERTIADAALTAGTLANISGRINFDSATRSAANLSAQLGVSVGLARALAKAGAAKGDGGTVVFDPRDPRYNAAAAGLAKTAITMTKLREEAELAALSVGKADVALGKVGSGGGGGSAGKAATGIDKATVAAQKLQDELDRPMISAIDGVSNAFGDFIAGGLKDFGGFVKSILASFKSMLSQMIATSIANPIKIAMGFGGTGVAAAGQAVAGGGAGGAGSLATVAGGLGSALTAGGSLVGVTGLAGGFGAGVGMAGSALASGGVGAMAGTIGAQVGAATTAGASMAAVGAAIGAVALPLLAVAAVFAFFKTKTKELDAGLRISVNGTEALVEGYKKVEKSRFFGLSKKVSEQFTDLDAATADPLQNAIQDILTGVAGMASSLGVASSAFDSFTSSVIVSTKGMDEAEAQQAIAEALVGIGNEFAALIPELEQFTREGEESAAALTRLVSDLGAVNRMMDTLGTTLMEVSVIGAGTASNFAALFGGIDAMNTATTAFFLGFFTETERFATAQRQIGAQFEALNLIMPETRAQFRALVEAQDLTTEAGRAMFAALVSMSGALNEVLPAFDSLADKLGALVATAVGVALEPIDGMIQASTTAANQARQSATAFFQLADSLRAASGNIGGVTSAAELASAGQEFTAMLTRAVSGDVEALSALGGAGQSLASDSTGFSASSVDLKRTEAGIRSQLNQGAAVAEALGLGADHQALLFDVETASLEVTRDILASGNVSHELLQEQIDLLENIGRQITDSANLQVQTGINAAGLTVAALLDNSGRVVAGLSVEGAAGIAALESQTSALNSGYSSTVLAIASAVDRNGAMTAAQIRASLAGKASDSAINAVLAAVDRNGDGIITTDEASSARAIAAMAAQGLTFGNAITGQTASVVGGQNLTTAEIGAVSELQAETLNVTEMVERATGGNEKLSAELLSRLSAGLSVSGIGELNGGTLVMVGHLQSIRNSLAAQAENAAAEKQGQIAGILADANPIINAIERATEKLALVESSLADTDPTVTRTETYTVRGVLGIGRKIRERDVTERNPEFDRLTSQAQANKAGIAAAQASLQPLRTAMLAVGVTPQFASGGMHTGGMRIVGENGPEAEFTGPSRIASNSQTNKMFDMSEVVEELRDLKKENLELRQAVISVVKYTKRTSDMGRKHDIDGTPPVRT